MGFFSQQPIRIWTRSAVALLCALMSGCDQPPTVVVYTSVDEQFARELLAQFEKNSGIRVAAVYDSEAGKTTGLVRRIEREKERPRCDVWWSSEVFGTIELARQGLLTAYESAEAADIPPKWRDHEHRWTGVAARARVLAFDPRRVRRADAPQSWRELAEPRWAARTAVANPQFGTTRGHVAAMFAYWGDDAGRWFLQTLRDAGTRIADGNSQSVALVVGGSADIALTDSDDVWVAQARGATLDLTYPALDAGAPPIWIPCSVALVHGGPRPTLARKLVDFLVSADAERALAQSDSRNVPLRSGLRAELELAGPEPAPLDFERIADAMPAAMAAARDILLR